MLYISSPELVHLLVAILYSLISPQFYQPLVTNILLSVSISLAFLDSTYKWDHTEFVFLCLAYLTWHNAFKVHHVVANGRTSFLFEVGHQAHLFIYPCSQVLFQGFQQAVWHAVVSPGKPWDLDLGWSIRKSHSDHRFKLHFPIQL